MTIPSGNSTIVEAESIADAADVSKEWPEGKSAILKIASAKGISSLRIMFTWSGSYLDALALDALDDAGFRVVGGSLLDMPPNHSNSPRKLDRMET